MCRCWAPLRSTNYALWPGRCEGSTVEMVNSTAVGGGVAEILSRMMPLLRELGLDARWHVMEGGADFFEVTKAFHNSLHGEAYKLGERGFEIYRDYNRRNLRKTSAGCSLHGDSRSAARRLHRDTKRDRQHWIWRCHIDLSRPDPNVWNFLEPFVNPLRGLHFFIARIRATA